MSNDLKSMLKNANKAANILGILANTKRLMILCHLIKHDFSSGELAGFVGLSNSALSQHLAKLKAMDIVQSKRIGKEIVYSISDPNIKEILDTLYRLYCK